MNKIRRACFSLILFAGIGFPALICAQSDESKKGAPPAPGSAARARILKEFDKDGDGKLNADEKKAFDGSRKEKAKARLEEARKNWDKDGDGKLSDDEKKARRDAAREKGKEKARASRDELLKRFDKNGDGKLDADERKAVQDAAKEKTKAARKGKRKVNADKKAGEPNPKPEPEGKSERL